VISLSRVCAECAAALQLLTRLPPQWLWAGVPAPLVRSVWAWPLIGGLLGALGGLVDALARWLGLPPALAALWTLASLLLLTGALHEDGLVDAADGIFGGGDPARRLAIMRDSRIGAFGALALILSLGLRASALAALPGPGSFPDVPRLARALA
jgi:adenosylcobinamide-GDP ribazoletransferase